MLSLFTYLKKIFLKDAVPTSIDNLNLLENDRIYFKGSPWPEGHRIEKFQWTTEVKGDDVWLNFHLETADYDSERNIPIEETVAETSDWEAPIVWCNYHKCTISSNHWHEGGFKLCQLHEYHAEYLDGLELAIDSDVSKINDLDALAFHIYLLGHDAVAKHRIKFIRQAHSDLFTILWRGKIALIYSGENTFDKTFELKITNQVVPEIQLRRNKNMQDKDALVEQVYTNISEKLKSEKPISQDEEVVYRVFSLYEESNSGASLEQFFRWSNPQVAQQILAYLHKTQLSEVAAVVEEAIDIAFPSGIPDDPEAYSHCTYWSETQEEQLSALFDKFVVFNGSIIEKLAAFVDENNI